MSRVTCTKRYNDFPFAHRQHNHDGHCALIHGHNWSFEFEFAADVPDVNGFVVDFGKLKWLKAWLGELFDHTLVLNELDPCRAELTAALGGSFARIIVLPDASCEGLARWLFTAVDDQLALQIQDRGVRLVRVTVLEDSRNSATYTP